MINVLDIDVDLFLDTRPRPSSERENGRVVDPDVKAWDPDRVCSWVRSRAGLNSEQRLAGCTFNTHEQLLDELAKLQTPVHLYHLDSHADLGVGYDCSRFYHEFLAIVPEARASRLQEYEPQEGDFLLYAIACDFVGAIDYVAHPQMVVGEPDLPVKRNQCKNKHDDGVLNICRRHGAPSDCAGRGGARTLDRSIPIRMHNRDCFQASNVLFERIFITKSPWYTPEASDRVAKALEEMFLEK